MRTRSPISYDITGLLLILMVVLGLLAFAAKAISQPMPPAPPKAKAGPELPKTYPATLAWDYSYGAIGYEVTINSTKSVTSSNAAPVTFYEGSNTVSVIATNGTNRSLPALASVSASTAQILKATPMAGPIGGPMQPNPGGTFTNLASSQFTWKLDTTNAPLLILK